MFLKYDTNNYYNVQTSWLVRYLTGDLKPDIFFTFCQALVNNPKIDVRDGTYGFKPKYNLKDKKALLRLLDKHDQLGLGGVLLDDVEEGLPNSAKAIKVTNNPFNSCSSTCMSAEKKKPKAYCTLC